MLFSVLIAHYNNSRFLEKALESVLNQTYSNWEIILVDDASTDGFWTVIAPWRTDSRIKIYYNEKNEGVGYTKRKCAELANGSILAFLDPDDSLAPEALQVMTEAHLAKPGCSLIHSTHYICNEALEVNRLAEYVRRLPDNTPYLLLNDGSIHHFVAFKKEGYKKTAGISAHNKKAVDQDLYYKLEETGDVLFIDQPLYYYRIHGGSISTEGKEWQATLWHYTIIEEACMRRIRSLDKHDPQDRQWIKKYRTRYYKIRIFNSYRRKHWGRFIYSLVKFPFVGGMQNLVSYSRKLPKEGFALIRRSFTYDHQIKA